MTLDEAEIEEWRPVPGRDGEYEVSSLGRVRSLDRVKTARSRWGGVRHVRLKGRVLVGCANVDGYIFVSLGRGSSVAVHRLVLLAFRGPGPDGCDVCHGNGVRSDNRLSNLRWGTRQENVDDAKTHGTMCVGARVGTSKLTDQQAREILTSDMGCRRLARAYGVSTTAVKRIRRCDGWKHVQG